MNDIEFELNDFSQALYYQRQADNKSPASIQNLFIHGISLERLYSYTRYATCYSALGIQHSVLVVLVPIIIEDTNYLYEALFELRKYFKEDDLLDFFSKSYSQSKMKMNRSQF